MAIAQHAPAGGAGVAGGTTVCLVPGALRAVAGDVPVAAGVRDRSQRAPDRHAVRPPGRGPARRSAERAVRRARPDRGDAVARRCRDRTGQQQHRDRRSAYRAFLVWSGTDLNVYRLTSAVELYGADGRLVSRFALNLPDYAAPPHQAAACRWAVVDEMSPFGSSERHVLRASRAICERGARRRLDRRQRDARLSDAAVHRVAEPVSRVAAAGPPARGGRRVRDATSSSWPTAGAARRSFNSGTSVWPLPDAVFQRLVESRDAVLGDGRSRRGRLPRVSS